ncbi:MAG: leucine-rich repeat domain-containing protein [Aureispira sp.]|nr:leucine-rich repeat domain-containing protein [Aureispira sp.]
MPVLTPQELNNLKTLLLSLEPNNWEIAIQILIAHKNEPIVDHQFLSLVWGIIVFKESKMQIQSLWQIKKHLTELIQIGDQDFYKQTKHLAADFRTFTTKFRHQPDRLYNKLSAIIDNSPLDPKMFLVIPLQQPPSNFIYSWQCRFLLERALFSVENFQKLFIKKSYNSSLNAFSFPRIPLQKIPKKYLESLNTADISHVSISCNQAKEVPSVFYQLTELEYLSISQNPIQYINADSKNWPKLSKLILYRCKQLQELPNALIQSAPLSRLEISSCQLHTFPTIVLKAKKLEYLSLAGNKFPSMPSEIEQLQKLETLDLDNNINLKQLPESLSQLQQLYQLKLSNCALTTLPSTIGALKNLQNLRLANNQLQELPDSFFELDNLEELSISNNQIPLTKDFLDRLLELPKLRYLLLDNLPITPQIYQEYYLPILKPRFRELYIKDPAK